MRVCEASVVSNLCWSRSIPGPPSPGTCMDFEVITVSRHGARPPSSPLGTRSFLRRGTRSSGKRRKARLREVRHRLAGLRARIPAHLSEASAALHRAALLNKDSYIIRDNYQLDPRLPADNWQCQPLTRVLGSPASLLVRDSLLMCLPRSFVFVSACGHTGPTRLG